MAYEHDEDFSSHLALLCHVSLLLVDQEEPLVAAAAQQLLVNCLYSLSAHHLEIMQEEGQHVDCLQVCTQGHGLSWDVGHLTQMKLPTHAQN